MSSGSNEEEGGIEVDIEGGGSKREGTKREG